MQAALRLQHFAQGPERPAAAGQLGIEHGMAAGQRGLSVACQLAAAPHAREFTRGRRGLEGAQHGSHGVRLLRIKVR